jgi:thiamine transport system ATP-binding protein
MTGHGAEVVCEEVEFSYRPGAKAMRFDGVFPRGEVTALLGPSGSGKSTLLNLLAGFEVPQSGRILFDGTEMTTAPVADRPVSMIFQENNLFSHMSVADNVALGISPSLHLSADQRETAKAALSSVGLAGYGDRKPAELSGGERQRVALARVIVRRQPILLLDEAFASLGPALRRDMLGLVAKIAAERHMTVVMVTHFPEDARHVAGRTMFLADGRSIAAGPTGDLLDADTTLPPIRDYLGSPESGSVRD